MISARKNFPAVNLSKRCRQRKEQHASTSVIRVSGAWYSRFILHLIILSSMFHRQMWCRNNNFFIIRHCLRCIITPAPGPLPDLHIQVGELTPTIGRTSYRRNVTTSARRNTQIAKSPRRQRTKQHATTTVIGGALAWYSKFILHFILLSSMFHKQMWCRNNNFLIICHCLRCVTRR